MNRSKVLMDANEIISHDRNNQYGEPENNFKIISTLWSSYLDKEISPGDVCNMMALFKIGRLASGTAKADSYIDAIGYLAIGAELEVKDK